MTQAAPLGNGLSSSTERAPTQDEVSMTGESVDDRTPRLSERRLRALDGLRGVAAFLILFHHATWTSHISEALFVANSYVVVDLFFILSGIIISEKYMTVISRPSEGIYFVVRRFFRVYPVHLLALAMLVSLEISKLLAITLLGVQVGTQRPFSGNYSIELLVMNLFLLQGLNVSSLVSWNGPSWSISTEFAAYILFALACVAQLGRSRLFHFSALVFSIGAYAWVIANAANYNMTSQWGILRSVAGFSIGMLLAVYLPVLRRLITGLVAYRVDIAVAAVAVAMIASVPGPLLYLVVPLFAILVALVHDDQGSLATVLGHRVIQTLGRLSYSIYMLHTFFVVLILIALKRLAHGPTTFDPVRGTDVVLINPWLGDLVLLVLVVVVLLASHISFSRVERPGRALGSRLLEALRGPNRAKRGDELSR